MTSINSGMSLNEANQRTSQKPDHGEQKVLGEFQLTYGAVQRRLRAAGIVICKRDQRYRVNFFSGLPETARFSNDLKGALEAGLSLAATRKGPAW